MSKFETSLDSVISKDLCKRATEVVEKIVEVPVEKIVEKVVVKEVEGHQEGPSEPEKLSVEDNEFSSRRTDVDQKKNLN